jgi:Lysozyme like domain
MKKAALALGGLWLALVAFMAVVVLNPAGDSPAASSASALTLMAAAAEKEGQGDLLCGPAGAAGEGAVVAAMAAKRAGWTGVDLEVAVAVAGAESTWNPDALNDKNTNGSSDFGMWQINSVHATTLASGDWRDPYDNALMARRVWLEAGGSWRPWVTFNTGAYRRHLLVAQEAVRGGDVAAVQPCTGTVGGTGGSGGPMGGDDRLTAWTRAMRDEAHSLWPRQVIGCYRPGTWGEHRLGRACDIMTDRATGDQVATWALQNSQRLHVMYVIWRQHIWSVARADEGWRPMADRGSITQNHYDHVHISIEE